MAEDEEEKVLNGWGQERQEGANLVILSTSLFSYLMLYIQALPP